MRFACLIALATSVPIAALAEDGPAGRYRLSGEHDVASELVLTPDGRFRYFLAAGALDERAEGSWVADNPSRLHLYTRPKPVPAVFSAGAAAITTEAPLRLLVTWPDGSGIAGTNFQIGFDIGEPVEDYTQDYGWSLSPDEKRIPRWVEFSLPMHQLTSQRFPIDTTRANALTFVITPNDLGTVDFDGALVDVSLDRLEVHRNGVVMTFKRPGADSAR